MASAARLPAVRAAARRSSACSRGVPVIVGSGGGGAAGLLGAGRRAAPRIQRSGKVAWQSRRQPLCLRPGRLKEGFVDRSSRRPATRPTASRICARRIARKTSRRGARNPDSCSTCAGPSQNRPSPPRSRCLAADRRRRRGEESLLRDNLAADDVADALPVLKGCVAVIGNPQDQPVSVRDRLGEDSRVQMQKFASRVGSCGSDSPCSGG